MSDNITHLTKGDRFTAVTTGVRRGERIYTQREFVASRDQEIEQFFVPPGDDRLAQDRIFVEQKTRFADIPTISVPELVVSGSIIKIGVAA